MLSLKFFFNRKGRVVYGLLILGWIVSFYHVWRLSHQWASRGALTGVSYFIFLFLAFLITAIRFYPWYSSQDRGHGIEEHFQKTMVPLAYILIATNLIFYAFLSPWPILIFVILLLLVIQSVNLILIYFHWKDKDSTPPSYFSRSLYKKK